MRLAEGLRGALVHDYAGFSFEIRGVDSIKETGAIRATVKVRCLDSGAPPRSSQLGAGRLRELR